MAARPPSFESKRNSEFDRSAHAFCCNSGSALLVLTLHAPRYSADVDDLRREGHGHHRMPTVGSMTAAALQQ
jgi:hypothetical protein